MIEGFFAGNLRKSKNFIFSAFFSLISTTFTCELVLKIEVVERVKNLNLDVVKFILDGVNIELANAFRRIILTEVPFMAITRVLFIENDTVLYNEMIAH